MGTISRSRRAVIRKTATEIRHSYLRDGGGIEQTAKAILTELPEVRSLEAWRLALGWSRSHTVEQVGDFYRSRGLRQPGLSESMICRWEHQSYERPSGEYVEALCAVYQARPEQLGLGGATAREYAGSGQVTRYSASGPQACAVPARESMVIMTTAAGLPAVRESLHLALLAEPSGSTTVVELTEAAVEHYALGYSKHPPGVLFNEVHGARGLLLGALTAPASGRIEDELRRGVGWLSALLGNLSFHLGDATGARVHLATAATYGQRTGDARLAAWAWGAQAMVARAEGQHRSALSYAERAVSHAPAGLARAQAYAWAQLPSLAALGQSREAEAALTTASQELEGDPRGWEPGRFGFDAAEYALHEGEAHRALGRTERALDSAEQSLAATVPGTPGWAAASLLLAQAEVATAPSDAAERAIAVLARVPVARLRSTSRDRLAQLSSALNAVEVGGAAELRERVRALPPAIDAHGVATT